MSGRCGMDVISELVAERMRQEVPAIIPRNDIMEDLPAPKRFNRVHIITGMRRSGKTFYLFQHMGRLIQSGVPRNRIFYFDFSDDRLPTGDPHLMSEVLDEYWRQVPQARTQGSYLFLDEVQDCGNWQGTCRRVAENELVTLTVTGSSSKVSSAEIATSFRGRSHSHEMLPLSFLEFVRFHASELPAGTSAEELPRQAAESVLSPAERTCLEEFFDRYLVVGGFPDVQQSSAATRIEVLQGYVRDVVARDVAERMARPSLPLANQMALLILRNTSCEMSINGMVETLRASGKRVGWEKADEMARLFRQAYLYFEVHEYTRQLVSDAGNPPKGYAVDPGLAYAVSRASQEDIGKRLETAVYLELRRRMAGRRTDSVTSYTEPGRRQRKVDFLVGKAYAGDAEPAVPYGLIQVAMTLESDRTRQRELGSLDVAMERTGLDRATIVTLRDSEHVNLSHGEVRVEPAWRWFLAQDAMGSAR